MRRLIPRTLFARFVLIIIIPLFIGQLIAIFLFYDRHWYNVSYYTSNIIVKEIAELLARYHNKALDMPSQGHYLSLSYKFDAAAARLPKQPRIGEELEIFKNILNVKSKEKNIVRLTKDSSIEVLLPLNDGVMQITFPAKLLLNPTVYIFVLWLISLTIILLAVSLIFAKKQIRPILALASAADTFGKGGNSKIYKPSGALEIRKVGIAFLKMKRRIERQVAKRTTMLAMISHDLRTPLTRMKLQLELMDHSEEVTGLKQDILTMEQMITAYLDFSTGENNEVLQKVFILRWLSAIIKKWKQGNIEFMRSIEPQNVQVKIKPTSFERAISNILNNAIKYSTKIRVSVYCTHQHVTIQIEDNGTGINDTEKLLVFKPFYRSDKARHIDNSSNIGLGLAIAQEIVLDHKGSIVLEDSTALGGLSVKITLPKLSEHRVGQPV